MKKIIFIAMVFVFTGTIVFADCENPRDDFDGLYCLTKLFVQADNELNEAYKKLTEKLDEAGKKLLKKSQIEWIKTRNNRCSFRDDRGFFVNMKCSTDITVERTNFLNDRYRECVSTGCMNGKLK